MKKERKSLTTVESERVMANELQFKHEHISRGQDSTKIKGNMALIRTEEISIKDKIAINESKETSTRN